MFFTYIIYSKSLNKYYIGYTANLEQRLREHINHTKGYTGKASDWNLVYYDSFIEKDAALKREIEIKKWKSRKKIEELISSKKLD